MVGARASRARADEARPPAPSVSRQVHAAARRDAARAARARRAAACSTRSRARGRRSSRRSRAATTPSGVDVAAFNCLLMRVKTARYNPSCSSASCATRSRGSRRAEPARPGAPATSASGSPRSAAARAARLPRARRRLRARRRAARRARARGALGAADDALRPRLPAARRSASRTGATSTGASAGRSSAPRTSSRRYTLDTLARLKEFARVRAPRRAEVLHGDARELELGGPFDGVVTSPPYPGLIDYHEQHRYAYELLGLDDRRELRARRRRARDEPGGVGGVRRRDRRRARVAARESLEPGAPVLIVVNDRRELYPGDPRAGRLAARRALPPPREPAHRVGGRASTSRTCSSRGRADGRSFLPGGDVARRSSSSIERDIDRYSPTLPRDRHAAPLRP